MSVNRMLREATHTTIVNKKNKLFFVVVVLMLMCTHTSLQTELAMATAAVKKRKRIVLTIEDKLELAMATAAVKKRKRIVLTIEDKLEICKLVKQGEILANLAALFNIGKSTVHDIITEKPFTSK